MRKFTLVPLSLLAALGARATTISDNLAGSTFATELISGPTWIASGFQTGSSSYLLNSAAFLMQQDSPGTLNVGLYSNIAMEPANNLGFQPGAECPNIAIVLPLSSSSRALICVDPSGVRASKYSVLPWYW
jgi:hypothetical protein